MTSCSTAAKTVLLLPGMQLHIHPLCMSLADHLVCVPALVYGLHLELQGLVLPPVAAVHSSEEWSCGQHLSTSAPEVFCVDVMTVISSKDLEGFLSKEKWKIIIYFTVQCVCVF